MFLRVVTVGCLAGCSLVSVVPNDDERGGGNGVGGNGTGVSIGGAAQEGGSGGGGTRACSGDWMHILGGTGANWLRGQAVGPDGSVAVTVDNTADLSVDGVTLDVEPEDFGES